MRALIALCAVLVIGFGFRSWQLADERQAHAETRARHAAIVEAAETAARAAVESDLQLLQTQYDQLLKVTQDAQTRAAAADRSAADARAAGERLRDSYARALAALRDLPGEAPATPSGGTGADATIDLLVDMQRRLDSAADDIAAYADRLAVALSVCEQYADTINPAAGP